MTVILHKYECLAYFTNTNITKSSVITMLLYYCIEEIREKVMMRHGHTDRDWAGVKKEILVVFRYSDSQPNSLVYTHRYLEQLCEAFGG